jgi:hypothetical protein
MLRKKKGPSTPQGQPHSQPDRFEPQWVSNMHAHYAKTGQYRSEDLQRVLGDPRSQVSPRPSASDLAFAAKK